MSNVYNVAVVVGSLRKASINRKVALALAELAPANLKLEIVEIGDLPLYNEDIDGDSPPAAYSTFRQKWVLPTRCCLSRPSTTVRCRRH